MTPTRRFPIGQKSFTEFLHANLRRQFVVADSKNCVLAKALQTAIKSAEFHGPIWCGANGMEYPSPQWAIEVAELVDGHGKRRISGKRVLELMTKAKSA